MGEVSVVVAPGTTGLALLFVGSGITLGTVSGLTPGLHANNFALLLGAVAPAIPGPPGHVAAAMLAAAVVHTFLDVVPALSLGVPDAAMAASALPGHRLVLAGRGREALRLSALGSLLAICFAVPLAIPLTEAMVAAYPAIRAHLPTLLAMIGLLLVTTELGRRRQLGAAISLAGSGLLGIATLDLSLQAPLGSGNALTPLFAGLFGAPVLIEALTGDGVPPQEDPTITISRPVVILVALVGTVAGAIVGFVPGVSSAIAATGALVVIPSKGPRAFVVATSGVNTSNAVFALFALIALGSPRTGVLVAMDESGLPLNLPLLLAAVGIAASVGFVLVAVLGDRYLSTIGALDQGTVSVSVSLGLAALSYCFAGALGLGIFAVATLVGLVPGRFGCRRASLMGVLIVPLAIG
ncbi:MAG: tripartite tricarboxylate transporter permease [Haloarculaceae archaeon]